MPKNKVVTTKKGRLKSIMLSTPAALIYHQVKKKRPAFDFSRYVSEHIIRDFYTHRVDCLKLLISENQKKIDDLYKENKSLVEEIQHLKNKENAFSFELESQQ
jgi:hypothetical protein